MTSASPPLAARRTFDRLVDGSRNILVRFDKEYSYGDEHDAWKDFAKTVGESSADVLIADVGVSGGLTVVQTVNHCEPLLRFTCFRWSSLHRFVPAEYGDKDNSDLSERYGIKSEDFPQYRFWGKGSPSSSDPVPFTGAKKKDNFLRFIQDKAGAWIGLAGQVKAFDALAKEFVG